jgi:hypothetical protein
MTPIGKISAEAANFPNTVVDFSDLQDLEYRFLGRGTDGTIDCLGVAIEIFRRAGLGLPDPNAMGNDIDQFRELFDRVSAPDYLFDLAWYGSPHEHVHILVRPGIFLSAKQSTGVYTVRAAILTRYPEVRFYRVRSECLPV